jgi:hypothetical protein
MKRREDIDLKSAGLKLDREVEKLIAALRGSYKGADSLVAARERDHKRDERAKSKKLGPESITGSRELNARTLMPRRSARAREAPKHSSAEIKSGL